MPRIHANPRTTPRIRREIQQAPAILSHRELARRYGIHRHTVAKWRKRANVEDRSARPKRLQTTLTEAQELVIVEVRKLLLLPLDDLLVLARTFLNPNLSRSRRYLRRHGVSNLRILQKEQESIEGSSKSTTGQFKAYEPGFLHIDVKYLPQMPDEEKRRYLFVAIDRATRWVYLEIHGQTNGMRERFNGRIAEILHSERFVSVADLKEKLTRRLLYNHSILSSCALWAT